MLPKSHYMLINFFKFPLLTSQNQDQNFPRTALFSSHQMKIYMYLILFFVQDPEAERSSNLS